MSLAVERLRSRVHVCAYQPHTLISGAAGRATKVPAIMSAVTVGEDGIVAAKEVADAVAGVMCALNRLESRQYHSAEDASVNEFRATRQAEGLAKVAGLDAEEFKVRAPVKSREDGNIAAVVLDEPCTRKRISLLSGGTAYK